jgi:nucleoside permease NupC
MEFTLYLSFDNGRKLLKKVSAKICLYFPKDGGHNHFSDLFNDQAHDHILNIFYFNHMVLLIALIRPLKYRN